LSNELNVMNINKNYHDLIIEALGRSVSPIERHAIEKKIKRRLKIKLQQYKPYKRELSI
jgi:hypothetical protein